jgi:type II secretion system protein I
MARPARAAEQGFTLVEALVALGIVASVVIGYIGIRTSALIDATRARNWRLAREIAEAKMSELQAGAREVPPVSGEEIPLEDYEGWSWKVVIGESDVGEVEAQVGAEAAGDDEVANERLEWQRDRDSYRKASSRGLSMQEYEEQLSEDAATRLIENAPSATEFEEVAVVVYFPKLDPDYEGQQEALVLKARLSTLALSGMTPEQAASVAEAKGQGSSSGAPPAGGGEGGTR